MSHLIEIRNLTVEISKKAILKEISLKVAPGRITAIVGGSGSGKSTLANCILGLLPGDLKATHGQIIYDDKDLLRLHQEELRLIRGKEIAMIYQEPLWALNPLMTIGQQIDEVLQIHSDFNTTQRKQKILNTLARVQLPLPAQIYDRYPHQLSGGQRQRAMIAQALVASPKLIIADEPTSHLDVTVQAKIMDLFREFKEDGMTMLLISHDLGLVSHLAQDLIVLEKGSVVESGEVSSVMKNPTHPYTKALMEAFV